jgi:sialate O-acetylesterase
MMMVTTTTTTTTTMTTTAMVVLLLLLLLLHVTTAAAAASLRLPTFVDSHMVLQREPQSARLWGWADPGSTITVELYDADLVLLASSSGIASSEPDGRWVVHLPPQPASDVGGHTVRVSDGTTVLELTDVVFGDVYLCSGQSNMQFDVASSFNATEEIEDSARYSSGIRIATAALVTADTPQDDVPVRLI